jgi:predicted GH43/DUF377 family glycosyl hydrolase
MHNLRCHLLVPVLLAANTLCAQSWTIGPFVRPSEAPVIEPNPFYYFTDPITQQKTLWDGLAAFHPSATITPDGLVAVVFQAEGVPGKDNTGGETSRLALATSKDGLFFTVGGAPVLFTENDEQKVHEYPGGLGDPRIVVAPDGTYIMTYTQMAGAYYSIGIATSKNLQDWKKCGPAFSHATTTHYLKLPYKAGAILTELHNGRVQAVKLHGKYWMYWGEGKIGLATSTDLIRWTPVLDRKSGLPQVIMTGRAGHFDSGLAEVGPPPILTKRGIVLLYNGMNSTQGNTEAKDAVDTKTPDTDGIKKVTAAPIIDRTDTQAGDGVLGDANIRPGAFSVGEALFSSSDPGKLLARTDNPMLTPVWPYERHGQYAHGGTFAEGLIVYKGQWLLYYGGAETVVGVARAELSH